MIKFSERTKLILKILFSFGVLYFLFSKLDWTQVAKLLLNTNPILFSLPILVMVADRILMAWKWRMLLSVVSRAPTLFEAIRVYYVSTFQGVAVPLGGLGPDLIRFAHLRSSGISSHSVAISIIMERFIGLIATIIMTLLAAFLLIYKLEFSGRYAEIILWFLLVGFIGTVICLVVIFNERSQKLIYDWLLKTRIFQANKYISEMISVLKLFKNKWKVILFNLFLSFIEQLFPVVAFFLGAMILGIVVSFTDCLAIIPFSSLVERIPISYEGLGVREGVLVFLFSLLDVNYSNILVTTAVLFISYLVSLLPGAYWSIFGKKPDINIKKKQANDSISQTTISMK